MNSQSRDAVTGKTSAVEDGAKAANREVNDQTVWTSRRNIILPKPNLRQ
jgi:hypothetical protein